ncbi:nuclear transport factor 2 family protein [Nesterenkonia ebinurensis]|uniref:nuclear transport factor 2 family protein n=1 Tax=Nesterenkonia ebinurensis TaxID=2608252 RepID=UPI00123D0687
MKGNDVSRTSTEIFNPELLDSVRQLSAEFNWLLDKEQGRGIDRLFAPDGVYDLNGQIVAGREAIQRGFKMRASTEQPRTSLHVTTDVRAFRADGSIHSTSTMLVFAGDGPPPLRAVGPAVAATVRDQITDVSGRLHFKRRELEYIFLSGAPLSTPAGR